MPTSTPDHAFISVDAQNAFNTLHHAAIARGMVHGAGLADMLAYFLAGQTPPLFRYTALDWTPQSSGQVTVLDKAAALGPPTSVLD
jgi:hypothetical protein